jgi:hypothetical protein
VLVAELVEQDVAAPGEPRLERVWRVVEPGVHHAGVATGGVRTEAVFFVHDDDGAAGSRGEQCVSQREADDARTDDDHVGRAGHPSIVPRVTPGATGPA